MPAPPRLVVFDAVTVRGLILNDSSNFSDELAAFRVAFRGRRFRLLLTDHIVQEYESESIKPPQLPLQAGLARLATTARTIQRDESQLNRRTVSLRGFASEHRYFILDSIAAGVEYFITKRQTWLSMEEQARSRYNLHIVTPAQFVELEG